MGSEIQMIVTYEDNVTVTGGSKQTVRDKHMKSQRKGYKCQIENNVEERRYWKCVMGRRLSQNWDIRSDNIESSEISASWAAK